MKEFLEAPDFCRETFAGELSGEFRDQLVARMARTRRMARLAHGMRMLAVAALILFGAAVLQRPARQPGSIDVVRPTSGSGLAAWKVRSVQFSGIVRTAPLNERLVVRSAPTTVTIVHSDGPRGYEEISDEQMFRLLQGWSVALVKVDGFAEFEILTQ